MTRTALLLTALLLAPLARAEENAPAPSARERFESLTPEEREVLREKWR